MKYIKSKYNVVIENKSEGVLILNTYTAAVVLVPKEYWNKDYINEEDITEDWTNLIFAGIYIEENIDEYKQLFENMKNSSKQGSEELSITIAPTYLCNMECEYCFQEDLNYAIMTENDADNIFENLINIIIRHKKVHVTWFGGEPLLAIDIMVYLSSKIIDFCMSTRITYDACIITNGTMLTNEIIISLKKAKISYIQVTLDGKKYHDCVRKMKDGTLSYEKIIKNISEVVNEIDVVVRCNINKKNKNCIEEMIDDLMIKNKLQNKIYFNFYPVSQFAGKKTKNTEYLEFCDIEEYNNVLVRLIRYISKYQKPDSVLNMRMKPSCIPCEAIFKDTVCIDVYGDVYKCMLSMQNKALCIGNINDKSLEYILDTETQNGWLNFQWSSECTNCNILPLCHSGCLYIRRASGQNKICAIEKVTHKDIIKLIYEFSD